MPSGGGRRTPQALGIPIQPPGIHSGRTGKEDSSMETPFVSLTNKSVIWHGKAQKQAP